jgi:hypothetical protein
VYCPEEFFEMKTIRRFAPAFILCVLSSLPAYPATVFSASLSGNVYNPPRFSGASGFGSIVLSDDESTINVSLFAFNLSSAPTFSGLFGPGNINFGIPVFLSFPMFQNGSTYQGAAFTFVDQNFVNGLRAGQYMFNIFTADYPAGIVGGTTFRTSDVTTAADTNAILYTGGEIGGYLSAVPEPGSVVLAGLGFLAMTFGYVLKRRS